MNWSRLWSKFCDSGRIVPNPSRSASGPWFWVGRDENLKVEGVRCQTQTRSERGETDSENWAVVWTGQMGGNKTSLGKDFIKSWEDEDRENGWSNQERAWTSSYHGKSECYCRATVRDDPAIIQLKPIVEALRRTLKEQLWTT
ncbi:hypothetical protein DY000_02030735 [Brassica cretica]|uniref:Uncharacterized protein n=1 Tax=Brassica cretica TaxID=69181 RepID=A0ABQ7DXC4_BRACR|nr:hypothetical protein DY000_02030735 [Brassica cretica]